MGQWQLGRRRMEMRMAKPGHQLLSPEIAASVLNLFEQYLAAWRRLELTGYS